MAVHVGRSRPALERALLVWLGTVVVGAVVWLSVLLLGDSAGLVLAASGGVALLGLTVAIAFAVYYADRARSSIADLAAARGHDDRLEYRLRELVDGPLPGLIKRLRDGEPMEKALADFPPPSDPVVGRLLRTVVEGIAASEATAAEVRRKMTALADEASWLADKAVPSVATRIRVERAGAETALAEVGDPVHEELQRVLQRFAEELAAGERTSAAAMAACASAAARIQAQTTRMLGELRELEDRYGDDEVFADLLSLDHEVSQLGRLADSIALLSGGRSGRRWTKPIIMESILRGAMGRIGSYRRVQYHSTSEAAIAGFAAEGVMHVLAELMDNAANFSPHGSMVHVYVEEEDAGVVITLEDAGLGMRRRERERAERLVTEAADLTSLPGTRLGLAVVGRLARKHDLTVNFRPSSRGGTGVVVLIPSKLISHPPREDERTPGDGLLDLASSTAGRAVRRTTATDDDLMLPKRRRGAALANAPSAERVEGTDARPRDPGARFAAFSKSATRPRLATPRENEQDQQHDQEQDD